MYFGVMDECNGMDFVEKTERGRWNGKRSHPKFEGCCLSIF